MTILAKIICDSVGPNNVRLTTFVLRYPRFIHAELMTHRDFSRNASSSRAIPIETLINNVAKDCARPLSYRANAKGMQPKGEVNDQRSAHTIWMDAANSAAQYAYELSELGVAKEIANRLLEPFSHIDVVVSATRWNNFFALRTHEAAQAEIRELASVMHSEYHTENPRFIPAGHWHLPFITDMEHRNTDLTCWDLIKYSVARCARVSYSLHDGTQSTPEKDIALYERLMGAAPIHASPAEHQGKATNHTDLQSGNFHGWVQYRKILPNEYVK